MRRHYMKNRPRIEKPPRPHSALTISFWAYELSKCFNSFTEQIVGRIVKTSFYELTIEFRQELNVGMRKPRTSRPATDPEIS